MDQYIPDLGERVEEEEEEVKEEINDQEEEQDENQEEEEVDQIPVQVDPEVDFTPLVCSFPLFEGRKWWKSDDLTCEVMNVDEIELQMRNELERVSHSLTIASLSFF